MKITDQMVHVLMALEDRPPMDKGKLIKLCPTGYRHSADYYDALIDVLYWNELVTLIDPGKPEGGYIVTELGLKEIHA